MNTAASVQAQLDRLRAWDGKSPFPSVADPKRAQPAPDPVKAAPQPVRTRTEKSVRDIQDALNDERPRILLPGDGRLLSAVAAECGHHLHNEFFYRNGEVLLMENGEVCRISEQRFRTEVERHFVCYRQKRSGNGAIYADATMYESEARGIMASGQFTSQLRKLVRIHSPRLPVLRPDESIQLLPTGYDISTGIFTIGNPEFQEDMSLDEARKVLDDQFGEFEFADPGRSLSVSIAAQVGLVGIGLMPIGARRPSIVITKNAEGAGATCLASCIVWPVLGSAPALTLPDDDNETRKILLTAAKDARLAVIFDNIKHRIGGAALEAFISSTVYEGRLLGFNQSLRCPNTATVICTGNGPGVTPDMRRRSLIIELHLSVERAEDRQFKRPISDSVLTEMRPRILAAVWALIRHWDTSGRPLPSRSHSAFPEWARIIGGIVESAGYGCPLETANVAVVADEDGAAMRTLTAEMTLGTLYTSSGLVALCRKIGVFESLVGSSDAEMGRAQRSAFGKLLARYDNRQVGALKFHITGTGHGKRFLTLRPGDDTRSHNVPATPAPPQKSFQDDDTDEAEERL